MYADTSFSFSQSWATSITGVLTALSVVFSTTGVLDSPIPGIDSSFFLTLTVVYGICLALPALVYSTLQVSDNGHTYGRHIGFILSAALTGAAAGGQLAIVGAIASLSDIGGDGQTASVMFLGTIAAVMAIYVSVTTWQLFKSLGPAAALVTEPSPKDKSQEPVPLATTARMAALP